MVKKVVVGVFGLLLLCGLFMGTDVKAQTANPSQVAITVSGIPSGKKGLALDVTVDTSVVTLGSPSVSEGVGLPGTMSVGVFSDMDLSSMITITVPFVGVIAGMSSITLGPVREGTTPIAGVTATADATSVTVSGSSTSSTSSSSSSTGGVGGNLSATEFTVTIDGVTLATTNGLVVTVALDPTGVVALDSMVSLTAMGATPVLALLDGNMLAVTWDGAITDNRAVVKGSLKDAGMAGTAMISVTKVQIAGGTDVTDNVSVMVDPSTVTNSTPTGTVGGATFELIGPSSLVGPGKAAVALSVSGTKPSSATLNGKPVDFVSDSVGIAIITIPNGGSVDLNVAAGSSAAVSVGSVSVTMGSGGKPPIVTSVRAQNRSSSSTLRVLGTGFAKKSSTLEIVPTDRESKAVKVQGKVIKATYESSECIPNGSYLNVSTAAGTAAKKVKVRGSCSNELVE